MKRLERVEARERERENTFWKRTDKWASVKGL